MKFPRILFRLAGMILLIFCLEGCTEPADQKEDGPLSGSPSQFEVTEAVDFELPDLEKRPFRLSQHRGKPMLLIFSTTWCAYCRSELPRFRDIHERYASGGLVVVQIFIQESQRKVSSFARQNNLPYRVLLDEKGEVSEAYGIRGVPDMILLDRNGKLVCRHCPDLDATLGTLLDKPRQGKG